MEWRSVRCACGNASRGSQKDGGARVCLDVWRHAWIVLNLFALGPDGPLESGIVAFHLIVWKFILISFTQVDLSRTRFVPNEVWNRKGAVRRYISRVERLKVVVRTRVLLAEGKGEQPSLDKDNELTAPFGAFRSDGHFRWSEVMWNEIKSLELTRFVAPDPAAAPNTFLATGDDRRLATAAHTSPASRTPPRGIAFVVSRRQG